MTDFDKTPDRALLREKMTDEEWARMKAAEPGHGGGPNSKYFSGAKKDFALFGENLFGEALRQDTTGVLREKFDFPPFSVLNAREGQWQERKRAWLACGIKSEIGRGAQSGSYPNSNQNLPEGEKGLAAGLANNRGRPKQLIPNDMGGDSKRRYDASPGGSPRPAMDYRNRERGDGAGRPIVSDDLDPEKRAVTQAARGDARTFGSGDPGDPGDLAAGFKRKESAVLDRTHGLDTTTDPYRKEGQDVEGAGGSGTSIFDPVLCELSYKWFCPPNGLILDPFAGGSVRGIVAGLLGFRYHGIDLRPEQIVANEAQRALIAPHAEINWAVGDSNLLLPTAPEADFVFSCPPYGDLEQYSEDPNDLSNMTWAQFVALYKSIIAKAVERLKPNRFAVFVIGEYRDKKTGFYRGFVPLTYAAFRLAGAELYNEQILITAVGSLSIRVTKQFEASRKLGKTHQNVLCFVKGDPRLAVEAIRGSEQARTMPVVLQSTSVPETAPAGGSLASFLGSVVTPPKRDWTPDTPPELTGVNEVVLNFLTDGLEWSKGHRPKGVTVSTLDGQLTRFLPFGMAGGGNLDEAVVKRWAEEQLKGKKIHNANTRFDLHMAREWGVDLEAQGCTFTDIQHTAALLDDSRKKFALDVLAAHYLPNNVEVLRVDESRHTEYHAAEVADREHYTAQLVGRLHAVMYPELEKQDLSRVQALEDAVIPCVVEMEKNGAPIDVPMLKQWCLETEQQVNQGLQEIAREVGFGVNPDSNDDWQRLFNHFSIPFGGQTEGGKPSFTDKILKDIDNRYVQLARKVGKLASLRAKFLVAYDQAIADDGFLRYNLHQLRVDDKGTVRGRFSASDKNIQQVMNHDTHITSFGSEDYYVRRLFLTNFAADAAQIEFRLFAHYSDSPRLLKAYADDPKISFHRVAEGILKPYRSDLPYTKVKSMNFLFVYGGGKSHLADYLEVPQAQADEFYDIYHRAFPEVKTLSRKAEGLAKSRGYVRSLLGRRARFPDPQFAYKALNAVIQPTAADIFKTKVVEVHAERKRTGFVMRMPVHDELVGNVVDEEGARMVSEILNRQSFELKVPILWGGKTGATWAECK